jgi:uncharacterized protein
MDRPVVPRHFRSRYNFFVDRPDGVVGYNARTGTFAHFSLEVADLLRGTAPIPDSDEVESLIEMGFVHDGSELRQVIEAYLGGDTSRDLSLTIAPTLACNRSCTYCYQNNYRTDQVMSTETQDQVVRYVVREVQRGRRQVGLTWYGGEPLIAKDVVLGLSRRLREGVEAHGGSLSPLSIITNGVLLDGDTAEALKMVGIETAQVSFDALIDDGRDRRGVLDPDGGLSIILRHALEARAHMSVSIRVNVTRSGLPQVERMLEVLREHGLGESVHLARAEDLDGEAGAITEPTGFRYRPDRKIIPLRVVRDADALSRPEFARADVQISRESPEFIDVVQRELTPVSGAFCGATNGTLIVIDPDGDISRCWNSAGVKSEAIGNVNDLTATDAQAATETKWKGYVPFTYDSCETCRVLPLCKGGCSHPRVIMDSPTPPCESIKFTIDEYVSFIGRHLDCSTAEESAAD